MCCFPGVEPLSIFCGNINYLNHSEEIRSYLLVFFLTSLDPSPTFSPVPRARGSQAALKPEPATAFPTLTGGYHQPFCPSEKVLGGRGVCSPREPGVSCWAGGTGAPHGARISAAKGTPGSGRGDSQASPVASVCTTYGFQLFLTTYRILGQPGGYTARVSFSRDASRRNGGVRRLRMPHFQMRWGRGVPAASGQ